MARGPIDNFVNYYAAYTAGEPVANALGMIATELGYGWCSVGPFYMPPFKLINEYKFSLGLLQSTDPNRIEVMRAFCQGLETEAHSIEFIGDTRRLTNLADESTLVFDEERLQDYIMGKVSQDSGHAWDSVNRRDDSTPDCVPFTEGQWVETRKLLLHPETRLDYTIRSLPTNNITKLDLDVLFYNVENYQPVFLAETKMRWPKTHLNWGITRTAGEILGIPAGCVFRQAYAKDVYKPFGLEGYNEPKRGVKWDMSQCDLCEYIGGLLGATVHNGDIVQELTGASGRRSC